jgi:hypothetical protein
MSQLQDWQFEIKFTEDSLISKKTNKQMYHYFSIGLISEIESQSVLTKMAILIISRVYGGNEFQSGNGPRSGTRGSGI